MNWPDGRKMGPNCTRVMVHRMSMLAIPEGTDDPFGSGFRALMDPKLIAQHAREAQAWLAEALAAIKLAPDNPHGDDDEAIAGAILQGMKERQKR